VRQRLTFYVTEEQLGYLQREAAKRRCSLSSYIAGCVLEFHERAAVENAASSSPTPPFDILLRESEQRVLSAIAKKHAADAGQLHKQLAALTAMLDRFVLSALVHAPEVPAPQRAQAVASAERRYRNWREAVTELLDQIGAPHPSAWSNREAPQLSEGQV
jgi:hypothetical protein